MEIIFQHNTLPFSSLSFTLLLSSSLPYLTPYSYSQPFRCVKSVQIRSSFGPYSVQIRENTDQKKLHIWTLSAWYSLTHVHTKRQQIVYRYHCSFLDFTIVFRYF